MLILSDTHDFILYVELYTNKPISGPINFNGKNLIHPVSFRFESGVNYTLTPCSKIILGKNFKMGHNNKKIAGKDHRLTASFTKKKNKKK